MAIDNRDYQNKMILLCAGFVICLLVLSAYSNTLYAPFVLDDLHSFVREPKVLGFTFDLTGFANLAATKFGVRRFLPMLTFVFDLKWGGGSLAAFHVTNIVIHLLATFSLLFLLQSLLLFPKLKLSSDAGDNRCLSTILVVTVVGLWSLSPVQTNAVTYIVQRMTSIATLFYFLSLSCYLRGRFYHLAHGFSKGVLFFYLSSLICFLCAIVSKEIAATLPVIVLLVELLIVEESEMFAALKRHKKIVVGSALLVTALILYKFYNGWLLSGYSNRHFTLPERLLTQFRVVSSYCGILLLPLPMWLNLEHDVTLSTSLFSPLTTLFSLVFVVLVIYIAWKIKGKKPLLAFAIFWFFVNLLIESTIIPLELKFEHRLYLPSVGFYLFLVFGFHEVLCYFNGDNFSANRIKIFVSVAVIIWSGLSFLTYTRNMVWGDTVSLWQDCISKAPNKARTHSNLATAWLKKGEYKKAVEEGEKAIILGVKGDEEYWVAACDIIDGLAKMGEFENAVNRGELLLKASPEGAKKNFYFLFLFNLGQAYFDYGKFQSAFNYFLDGYKFCYRNDLPEGVGFEQSMERALKVGLQQKYQFDSDMKINTDNLDVAVDEKMAQVFFAINNFDLALKYAEKGIVKDDTSEVSIKIKREIERISAANNEQKNMGTLKDKYFFHPFASRFNFFMAISFAMEKYSIPGDRFLHYCLLRAETLNNRSPDFYIVKSWYFYKREECGKALEIIDEGIKLAPNYAQLWVNRGIYALAAMSSEALVAFDNALRLYPDHPHRKKILAMYDLAEKLIDQNAVVD